MPAAPVVIAQPPGPAGRRGGGLLQLVIPVIGTLGIVAFAVVIPNKLFLIMAAAFVGISIVTTLLNAYAQRRSGKRSARTERRLYRTHLQRRTRELTALQARQREIDERLYPDPARLAGFTAHRRFLWERRPADVDFLAFRVGETTVPLACPVELSLADDPLTEYDPTLLGEAEALIAGYRSVEDLSAVAALDGASTITLIGRRDHIGGLARSIVAQAATLRAAADLRVMASFTEGAQDDWSWLKWLPHSRTGTRTTADGTLAPTLLLAPTVPEFSRLLELHVQPRLEQLRRIEASSPDGSRTAQIDAPEMLLVLDGFHAGGPVARLPLVRELLSRGGDLKVRTLCLVGPGDAEPSEAQLRIEADDSGVAVLERTGASGTRLRAVRLDALSAANADTLARELAPLTLEENASGIDLAAEVRLAELLGEPAGDLCAPIGLSEEGDRLVLDLKQAAEGGMGPHGLLVGATGSGKSELLRTMVSSLAAAHTPEELCFVFVDFKGGAAFAELSQLPHAAGMITNLQHDLTLIDRMYQALYGEMQRRQSVLRDAGNVDDVTAYRARRAVDPSLDPLPHLLVIVDEFGELLANRPEFIELFLAIGRVGRSLGMHLLLSSQRLEEGRLRGLEGHLRYRICLRTYSAAESKAVLGHHDAFLLPPFPGVGYLSVDTDVYQRFKTALVTTPHQPEALDRRRGFVGSFGLQEPAAEPGAAEPIPGQGTELDALVTRLRRAHHGEATHQVWLAPLAPALALSHVLTAPRWADPGAEPASSELRVDLGLLDLPAQQRQSPFSCDLSSGGGHLALVGAPQTGKSTALRTLLMSLAATRTPDELRAYVLDFGGGRLGSLAGAPHVGGVAGKSDADRVRATVRQMRILVEARAETFRRLGIDSMPDARARGRAGELAADVAADTLLVIDNWGGLLREHEELADELTEIAVGGLQYGVHLIVTAGRWGDLRPAIREAFGTRLELRLNDPMDSDLGRRLSETLPADVAGRGITPEGLHFQIALPRLDGRDEDADLGRVIADTVAGLADRWTGEPAPAIRVLPERLTLAELPAMLDGGVAIGVEELTLGPVSLDLAGADQHLLVFGDAESGRTETLRMIAHGLARRYGPGQAQLHVVDFRRGLADLAELPLLASVTTRPPQIDALIARLRETTIERLGALDAGGAPAPAIPIFVLIDDYDLISGAAPNPLAGLAEIIVQGRDAGIHVTIARSSGGAARAAMDPIISRLIESGAPGIVLSGDPHEGPILRGVRAEPLPAGRGRLLRRRGRPTLIQLALAGTPADAAAPAGAAPPAAEGRDQWHALR